ncbi:MAG: family transposase [Thermomicrobiales bacterium]|nr:family transposase [Thermomicrobiales bacterium]
MVAETEVAGTWTFEDVCLWTYCLVDELWVQIAPRCRRPGPTPVCSDAELVMMALVGECCGWDQETEAVSRWRQHRDLFPPQPSRTRCNRRRRALQGAINELRRLILGRLDLAADRQCVIDSLPIPVITFHLVPGANRAEWQAHEARFGKVFPKRSPSSATNSICWWRGTGSSSTSCWPRPTWWSCRWARSCWRSPPIWTPSATRPTFSAPLAARLATENRVRRLTLPRRNARQPASPARRRLVNGARQIIEAVTSQLAEQFHIERNHAQSFWGLTARLLTKLTAHTLCLFLNRLLGKPDVLHIKALAFPIEHTGLLACPKLDQYV